MSGDELDSAPEACEEPLDGPGGVAVPALAWEFAGETPGRPPGSTGDGLVQIAYCHSSRASHSWHNSMMNMQAYDKAVGLNLIQSAPFEVDCSGPHGLVEGRNLAVEHFLDETEHEWLLWIDTDMGFLPDALDSLFIVADPVERPVIGALCFALRKHTPDGYSGWRTTPAPTLFGLARDRTGSIGFFGRTVYPRDKVVQVAGTGSAFILIHRSVFETIRAKMGPVWYELIAYENGKRISEDLSFCWRVGDAGFSIYVHTGVKTTHHKEVWVGEADYVMPEVDPMFKTEREGPAVVEGVRLTMSQEGAQV